MLHLCETILHEHTLDVRHIIHEPPCSIVHAPLRFMIFRLKATVMFGDAISAFDTRPLSYSEKPYQPSGKPELPKLKLEFHDSPDV